MNRHRTSPRIALATIIGFVALIGFTATANAQSFPSAENGRRVYDFAHVFSDAGRVAALQNEILAFEATSHVQLAVVTIESLGGRSIEDYANGLFRVWGIGQRGTNNGVLLLMAPNDHRVRIEVGYGLEGQLTDLESHLIIANIITPMSRDQHDRPGALEAATRAIIQQLGGHSSVAPPPIGAAQVHGAGSPEHSTLFWILVIFSIIAVLVILAKMGILFPILEAFADSRGGGGGGSSGGGGGDGGGFGGGSSGGGGASGDC